MTQKFILILAAVLLSVIGAFAQTTYDKSYLDSLFSQYVKIKGKPNLEDNQIQGFEVKNNKCGFFDINFVKRNIDLFTPEQQKLLKTLDGRPDTTQSIVSQSGIFRIHYYTDSNNKPKYFSSLSIEENLAAISSAIDSVYNFEVNYLGYPPPPSDNGNGGDNLYDIYIKNLGGSLYGYTETEDGLGDQKYTSFMVIDNDYVGYYSSGINGARVTLAHEFHHGIQMGNYILRFEDTFFYEITSTAMEEFVYDDVNDYYAYMNSYFLSPQRAFSENDGYNLAIWNIYLKENFGFDILKQQWELLPNQRAISAISTSLINAGSSFKHELNNFGLWTFYTKNRALAGKYFEEAANYPLIRALSTVIFSPPSIVITINSKPTANSFINFINQNNNDTLFVLLTNGDVQTALMNTGITDSIAYYLYDYPESGTNKIDSNYYSKFTTTSPQFWSISEILDTTITVTEPGIKIDFPFPMPFSYLKNNYIKIPITSNNNENVDFYVFSTAMELVYSNNAMQRFKENRNIILWNNVKDNDGNKLASGVYIYIVKDGDNVEKGKLVILHD